MSLARRNERHLLHRGMGQTGCSALWISWHYTFHAVSSTCLHLYHPKLTQSCRCYSGLTVALKYALTNKTAGWVAYAFIIIYQIFFGAAWLSVPWVYAPEISPLKYRHINTSAAVCSEWYVRFATSLAALESLSTPCRTGSSHS